MDAYQPQLFVSSFLFMQSVAAWVGRRYLYYISGEIRLDKAERFVAKMSARYALGADRVERQARRRKGRANFALCIFPVPNSSALQWFIFRTDGDLPAADSESWLDARSKETRVEFHGYRLVRRTVAKKLAEAYAAKGRKVSSHGSPWTWVMTDKLRSFWKEKVKKAGQHDRAVGGHQMLRQVVFALSNLPGFRGVREDWFGLDKLVGRQVDSSIRSPDLRGELGLHKPPRWVQKRCGTSYPLRTCVARYMAGEPSWFPAGDRPRLRAELWLFSSAGARKGSVRKAT